MLQENLGIFFDTRYGGSNGTVAGVPVVGIFSRDYVEIDNGIALIAGFKPIFRVKSSDAAGVAEGTDVTVQEEEAGVVVKTGTYKVITPQSDGTGATDLILEEQ
jgi:hypothetical protein